MLGSDKQPQTSGRVTDDDVTRTRTSEGTGGDVDVIERLAGRLSVSPTTDDDCCTSSTFSNSDHLRTVSVECDSVDSGTASDDEFGYNQTPVVCEHPHHHQLQQQRARNYSSLLTDAGACINSTGCQGTAVAAVAIPLSDLCCLDTVHHHAHHHRLRPRDHAVLTPSDSAVAGCCCPRCPLFGRPFAVLPVVRHQQVEPLAGGFTDRVLRDAVRKRQHDAIWNATEDSDDEVDHEVSELFDVPTPPPSPPAVVRAAGPWSPRKRLRHRGPTGNHVQPPPSSPSPPPRPSLDLLKMQKTSLRRRHHVTMTSMRAILNRPRPLSIRTAHAPTSRDGSENVQQLPVSGDFRFRSLSWTVPYSGSDVSDHVTSSNSCRRRS